MIDIRYICDIKKNMFNSENIIKLSVSIRQIRDVIKSFKIGTDGLKIEAKENNYITSETKNIIDLLQVFYIYIQILTFLAFLLIICNFT